MRIPNSEIIFGPPGCGKTYTLMEEVESAMAQGTPPDRIGYVSFTRKAIAEAVNRACAKFQLDRKQLPWFRTLHSWAFHGLGLTTTDMMGPEDWTSLSRMVGLKFRGTSAINPDDGLVMPAMLDDGDIYIQMENRARYRMVSIEREYNDVGNHALHFDQLRKVKQKLDHYKATNNKFDFADQIEKYVQMGEPPRLDLFIVDEAQDLTPLQWEMVFEISRNAKRVLIAGDDDQAIHRWTGVDVHRFLDASDNYRVLSQSYRMPKSVHNLSQEVVKRIQNGRREKDFNPTDEEGQVQWALNAHELELEQGSWTLMARTNSFVRKWGQELREEGLLYSIKGVSSINQKAAQAAVTWRRLQAGEGVEMGSIRGLYDFVPKQGDHAVVRRGSAGLLDAAPPDSFLRYDQLVQEFGLIAPIERDALDIARFGSDEKRYIRAIERRGEDITAEPRVKLSTFHGMKGGEDDNCAVFLASTHACVNTKHPDDEHRAMYVGLTRTKQRLVLVDTDYKYRYEL